MRATSVILLTFLTACGYVDQLDGRVEDIDNCCTLISPRRIKECLVQFEPPPEPGIWFCHQATCTHGTFNARLQDDGTITSCSSAPPPLPEDQSPSPPPPKEDPPQSPLGYGLADGLESDFDLESTAPSEPLPVFRKP